MPMDARYCVPLDARYLAAPGLGCPDEHLPLCLLVPLLLHPVEVLQEAQLAPDVLHTIGFLPETESDFLQSNNWITSTGRRNEY